MGTAGKPEPGSTGRVLRIVALVVGVGSLCVCSAGGGCLWFGAHLRDEQIERRTQELIRQGNAPEEARREAERETSSESHDFDWD